MAGGKGMVASSLTNKHNEGHGESLEPGDTQAHLVQWSAGVNTRLSSLRLCISPQPNNSKVENNPEAKAVREEIVFFVLFSLWFRGEKKTLKWGDL